MHFYERISGRGSFLRGVFRCAGVIKRSGAVSFVIILLFVAAHAYAGEIEPRAYVNTPVGINFLLAGYAYTDGGLATSGSSPLQDAHLTMHTGILAFAR